MKRFALVLLAAVLMCGLFAGCGASWEGVADDAVVARVGDFSITYRLLKYYSAQQEIGLDIANELLREQGAQVKEQRMSTEDYLQELMERAALAQLALEREDAVSRDDARRRAEEEFAQVNYDYLEEYNQKLKEKMGLSDEELLKVAAEDRFISANADLLLDDVITALKDTVSQDRLEEETAKKLAELTNGIEMKQLVPRERILKPDFKTLAAQAAVLY